MGDYNTEIFRSISMIIQRDSKTSTYKFALLRGTIDVIQENSPFIKPVKDRAHIPTGLLIEKWLVYYYPLLESTVRIPQISGSSNLAFEELFLNIIRNYQERNGFSEFYNDLRNKGIPQFLKNDFLELVKKVRNTIINMPMKYLGRSISNEYYSVYRKEKPSKTVSSVTVDYSTLIEMSGTFSIPIEYYHSFQIIGSFIGGQDSLLFKWAEFSVRGSSNTLSMEKVLQGVLTDPVTEREVAKSKSIYLSMLKEFGKVLCVWSGEEITSYDVDHVIPFSIWKNNDLWNLLPAKNVINNLKRDKIPSPKLIDSKKDNILKYWNLLNNKHPERFQKEIRIALLGDYSDKNWQDFAIGQLKKNCKYLIEKRGYQEWNA